MFRLEDKPKHHKSVHDSGNDSALFPGTIHLCLKKAYIMIKYINMIKLQLKSYFKKCYAITQRGDAREESYYSALEELFTDCAAVTGYNKVQITSQPKKTEAGNPDFRIWDGRQHITGYIEAKHPTTEHLDQIETSPQLKRYLNTFHNLILTNFFEFRLYRNGALIDRLSIGRPFTMQLGQLPAVENEAAFAGLLEKFFSFSLPKTYSAKSLALELAKKTKYLRDEIIAEELKEEETRGSKPILGFYEAFHKHLIFGLTKKDFADLYAQTITYGLFAARTRAKDEFNRRRAIDYIPRTIGILRDIFRFISSADIPQRMEWPIDDIAEVLAVAEVNQILHEYYHEGKGKDPIIHFYETFLSAYDPQTRERRGVYYTPEPVVSYIVRSLNIILKEYFGKTDGFAADSVRVLDPAAGTMTFIAEAIKLAVAEFSQKYGAGAKESFIQGHILNNFYAFELMMAPYAVGHLKMAFLLEEMGCALKKDDRFKLYLTNTLEMEELKQTDIPGMASLSEESHLAGKVKKETPILVVLGNPPYSGHSANTGDWISTVIRDYYQVDGKSLGEKNPKWLQDDYVKFIRFAQWKIDQAGEGCLGIITNHGYLDNPTFRGMRQSLMQSFDEIYILDLHGNAKKKEKCPDGSKDENVFDIQQGVAIALLIKKKGLNNEVDVSACPQAETGKATECLEDAALEAFGLRQAERSKQAEMSRSKKKIVHTDLWGLREDKYAWLLKNDIKTTNWQEIQPKPGFYFFIQRDEALEDTYNQHMKITDIFPVNSVGIVTARDKLTIKWTADKVWQTVLNFSKQDSELARMAYNLGKDTRDWKIKLAQQDLLEDGLDKKKIVPILYRPFDIRYTYYTGKSRGFICMPRPDVMRHMLAGDNLGLIACRQQNKVGFYHTFISENITESCVVSNKTREINSIFPLYLYPDTDKKHLFSQLAEHQERQPNINPKLIDSLTTAYKKAPAPEEIFYYIYAVLYANTYRTKYAVFLKTNFPRVPFTKDYKLFIEMGKSGQRLVDLHLLKSPEIDSPVARFQGAGDYKVDKPVYRDKRVYINKTQYFEGIEPAVWEYQVGGYQVLSKWLKDRRKRELSLSDIKHYCRIATAISLTITIKAEIDTLYPAVEFNIIIFGNN